METLLESAGLALVPVRLVNGAGSVTSLAPAHNQIDTVSPAGLEVPPLGVGGRKNSGAHPILQSAVCWYGRIGCAPEFFLPPTPLGP